MAIKQRKEKEPTAAKNRMGSRLMKRRTKKMVNQGMNGDEKHRSVESVMFETTKKNRRVETADVIIKVGGILLNHRRCCRIFLWERQRRHDAFRCHGNDTRERERERERTYRRQVLWWNRRPASPLPGRSERRCCTSVPI